MEARLWLRDGHEFASRVLVDMGLPVSLMRQEFSSEEVEVDSVEPSA